MKIPNLKNIFSKFTFHKKTEYKTISEKSNHDWKMILLGFIFLAIIMLSGSLYMFIGVSKGDIFLVEQKPENTVLSINKSDLASTIKFFETRKAHLEALKATRPTVGDPSL
jgi:hypothetical protein